MAEISALRDEAANPTTDPGRLAAIAQEHPHLGSVVAANPAAYEALLDWLTQHGDEAAKHAVAVRRGATPVLPVNPFAIPAVAANPFAVVAPREPRKRMSKGAKRGLVIGVVGTLTLLLAAGGGIAYVAVFGWPIVPAVRIADVRSEPRDDAWGLINPAAEAADFDDDLGTLLSATTVGQDRALVNTSASGDSDGTYRLSLVDTLSGAVLWTIEWEKNFGFDLLSEVGSTPFVIMANLDDEQVVLSIDAANGDIISENDDHDVQGVSMSAAYSGGLGLGGDVLLRTEDGISRFSANDLNDEKWSVDFDDESYTVVRDRLIIGEDAYDLGTGESVKWSASEDLTVQSAGRMLLGIGGNAREQTFYRLDERGYVYWKEETEESGLLYFNSDVLVIADYQNSEMVAFDMMSGDERWSEDFDGGQALGASPSAGILLLQTAEDEATAIDLATGKDLYDLDLSTDDRLVGMADTVFYLAESGGLVGYDMRTGDELWSFDNPDEYYFFLAGGNLVGVQNISADDAEDTPSMIGVQP